MSPSVSARTPLRGSNPLVRTRGGVAQSSVVRVRESEAVLGWARVLRPKPTSSRPSSRRNAHSMVHGCTEFESLSPMASSVGHTTAVRRPARTLGPDKPLDRMKPLLAALTIFALSGAAPDPPVFAVPVPQQPTFRSRAEAVRVSVLVTDGSKAVVGLRASDFELLDNGVPQRLELLTNERSPVGLVLALDVSQSVHGDRMERLIEACQAMLDGLKADDEISLLTFNHAFSLRAGPTRNIAQVRERLSNLQGAGSTALRDATQAALLTAETSAGRPLVVVFSDGQDMSSWLTDDDVLATARASEALIYAVRVGNDSGPFLKDVAHATGGSVFVAGSNKDLRARFLDVLEEFKSRYFLGFTPRNVSTAGWHRLEVRVRGRRVSVKARPGYFR